MNTPNLVGSQMKTITMKDLKKRKQDNKDPDNPEYYTED